ncbi:hypothetical protein NYQ10_16230 [Flavobacterium johnsoniae]|uniref:hypothetical protein n=1 Tax=Flavobacterium TaxID=237 RepID=UPI0023E428D0|nr:MULTISPECIES: hypothetical protein [Flavobacterium]WET02793.1 hypothetical protein P0R33_00380 [Flavobacterium sp. YJ01]WJS93640.1 hypothetical protein NYQ10_16230 [Flavobacterium johnsoniae]
MKNLKGIVSIIAIIVKYGAVVTAILKGIQVVSDELGKLDFGKDEPQEPVKSLTTEENE